MDQFQIIVSIVMLIIIVWVSISKIFANKDDEIDGLSPQEMAILFPETSESNTDHSKASDTSYDEFEDNLPFDVIDAFKTGQKLLAVKLYRQQFGTGLKESIAAVETSTVYREQFAINMKK